MAATPKPFLIHSSLLRVPHAFSTRRGGVSAGPFSSLNFGNPSDLADSERDPAANIAENLGRTLASIAPGAQSLRVAQVHQVHGADVHVIRRADPLPAPGLPSIKADALITDDPGIFIAVRTADCAPILLATHDGRAVAAIHAGWRGIVANIVRSTIRALHEHFPEAASSGPIAAAVGPCIGPSAFEIGLDVADAFIRLFGPATPHVRSPAGPVRGNRSLADAKFHADIPGALREQLHDAGVQHVEAVGGCTFGQPELFFSHRRYRGLTGRMISLIAPRQD